MYILNSKRNDNETPKKYNRNQDFRNFPEHARKKWDNSFVSPEQRKETARKAGIASGIVRKEKKKRLATMKEFWGEFLNNEHEIMTNNGKLYKTGFELLGEGIKKISHKGTAETVSLIVEIRKTLDGDTHNMNFNDIEGISFEDVTKE